ncbi:Dot/Icm secretion system substrate [Legionella steigerwaltii]|uniref:Dot/Icm secretion system substrate n=1 Tax=Legionella steigerwaltii TaxID=460 RepID=A0A378LD80_9GAMM|nr:hypothetical protein [Legionella steigerwaltii]KTD71670.1 substrate of the Dot/Icm secretion system [Legionella steigerwaltii]STY23838.1 Dot/Icm secretion system substrate [Legionella steigerwaltii]
MPTDAEKFLEEARQNQKRVEQAYEEQMQKSTKDQKKFQTLYEDLIKSQNPDPQKFLSAMESTEKAAYATYLARRDVNEAKANVAVGEYKKSLEDLDAQKSTLESQGKFTEDARKEYEQKREAAYQKYLDTKKQLDQDSMKGFDEYKQFCKENREKYDQLINPEDDVVLTEPLKTQTEPIVVTPLPSAPKKDVTVASELSEAIFNKFQEAFKDDPWYQKNPSKKGEDGKLNLSFKSEEDMNSFFQKMAKENKDGSFLIVDSKTNQVMAYGNKGQLFHANGDEFKTGDKMKPGGTALDSFKIPEQSEPTQTKALS